MAGRRKGGGGGGGRGTGGRQGPCTCCQRYGPKLGEVHSHVFSNFWGSPEGAAGVAFGAGELEPWTVTAAGGGGGTGTEAEPSIVPPPGGVLPSNVCVTWSMRAASHQQYCQPYTVKLAG